MLNSLSRVTESTMNILIPKPTSVVETGQHFGLLPTTCIVVQESAEQQRIAQFLADHLAKATGQPLSIVSDMDPTLPAIRLQISSALPATETERYTLSITPQRVELSAGAAVGLFRGIQTILQLLTQTANGEWAFPTGQIADAPRYAWRAVMLDVARHFFNVAEVKRLIDNVVFYKINRLHLHLTDDQGWRLVIESWPNLTVKGGLTQVNGGGGGYYTQADYAEIVRYAAERYIEVIPEIDMPGHTNAALAAYAELNCDGTARELYEGTEVGFSSLCVADETTYRFIDDVIREITAISPSPYIHIGGDESAATKPEDYKVFMTRVQEIVARHGKQAIGWEEVTHATLLPTTLVQYWKETKRANLVPGTKVILSPASKSYLDMKYDEDTALGLVWAGLVSVETGYTWDPETVLEGIDPNMILGIEAPLWTETILSSADIDFMVFPRLLGYAEIGWSSKEVRNWDEYKTRLAMHGSRLTDKGINFHRAEGIDWR
jgi:hexosaminidase